MTRPFTCPALPTRVVFGAHAVRRLFDEVAALGPHPRARALLPEQKPTGELLAAALGDRASQACCRRPACTPGRDRLPRPNGDHRSRRRRLCGRRRLGARQLMFS